MERQLLILKKKEAHESWLKHPQKENVTAEHSVRKNWPHSEGTDTCFPPLWRGELVLLSLCYFDHERLANKGQSRASVIAHLEYNKHT